MKLPYVSLWGFPRIPRRDHWLSDHQEAENPLKLGVIGTAGRKRPILAGHWRRMKEELGAFVELAQRTSGRSVKLVSGGAAGGDHTAVIIAKEMQLEIDLHLPAIGATRCQRTAVMYHHRFSNEIFGDPEASLEEIRYLVALGRARGHGPDDGFQAFFARNSVIADESDWLMAFTFGNSPPAGGTGDTWRKWMRHAKEGRKAAPAFYQHVKLG